jgi:hypothetical protein
MKDKERAALVHVHVPARALTTISTCQGGRVSLHSGQGPGDNKRSSGHPSVRIFVLQIGLSVHFGPTVFPRRSGGRISVSQPRNPQKPACCPSCAPESETGASLAGPQPVTLTSV